MYSHSPALERNIYVFLIIILFGTLYIISELRRKSAEKIRRHNNERERLIDKKDATDVLMSVESTQRENECFL
jgi:ABC-type nickel/cobalt efflux system permease component RcnA